MPSTLLIKNGKVIDPANRFDKTTDILVRNGKIAEIKSGISSGNIKEIIDATGLIVSPGFIDIHTHLREPGYEHKETIATGTASAIAGGFTSIACMANTKPVNDSVEVTESILQKAKEAKLAHVFPIAAITLGLKGETLSPMPRLKEAGVTAFSDDGRGVQNETIMSLAFRESKKLGVPIISHCENEALAEGGVMNEGPVSRKLGLKGISNEPEDRMIERDIRLASEADAHVHIAHISTAGGVGLVRKAKKEGMNVTCEVAPHHFTLTEECVTADDTNTKMNPPLRSQRDREALLEGLSDGTIDAVATDHAPHSEKEKAAGYKKAPFGIIGLETALPLLLNLVRDNVISLPRAVALLTRNPAKILRIPKGDLRAGADADITIFDPGGEWVVDPAAFKSKGRNTPFGGKKMTGRVCCTLVGGRILLRKN